jgi:hypothetical protein
VLIHGLITIEQWFPKCGAYLLGGGGVGFSRESYIVKLN